ncbi:MAG: group I truncated hemoglobin [Egibacteraceae bacterium]
MQPSIYERIGDAPSAEVPVDLFYEKVWVYENVWADPALADHFEGIDRARLKAHQRAFMAARLGGPERYDGRSTGEAHADLGATDAAFDQIVAHLAATLSELGVDQAAIDEIAGALEPLRTDIVAVAVGGS